MPIVIIIWLFYAYGKENKVLCWQHFSKLDPVVLGGSVGNGYTLHIFLPTLSSAFNVDL